MKNLREVINIVGMSRRVIQEYEKEGIAIKPKQIEKETYKYLLYNDEEIERLMQIRFYRELGYSKKRIKQIFDDPNFNKQEALEEQIRLLTKKKEDLECLLLMSKSMCDPLNSNIKNYKYTPFNDLIKIMSPILEFQKQNEEVNDEIFEKFEQSIDCESFYNFLEEINAFYNDGYDYNSKEVKCLFKKVLDLFNDDFKIILSTFISIPKSFDNLAINENDDIKEFIVYILNGLKLVISESEFPDLFEKINVILNEIVKLRSNDYDYTSNKVQQKVDEIYKLFGTNKEFSKNVLNMYSYIFESDNYINQIDDGKKDGDSSYVSNAIKFYLEKSTI